ncbi:TPA: nitroreductase family protein, partial [Vibrio parahaemolyticus]
HNKIRQVKVMTRGVGDGASLVAFIETDELLSDQEIDPAIIKDPAQRLAFKLEQHGIRRLDGKRIAFTPPKQSDVRFVRRRSCRSYSEQLVTKAQFQQVLQSLSQCSFDKLPFPKYRYGSAGGLYPVQIYIGIHPNKVEGIPSGLYYHDPRNNELVAVGDRPDGRVSGQSGPNIGLIESSAFAMYFVSNKSAIEPMYGQKMGEIFAAMEVGAICQMLEEEAANLDMGFCQLGAMDDRDLRRALELNDDYQVLHCSVAGVVPEQMHNQEAMFKDFSKYEKQPRLDIASEQNFDQALKDYLQESLPAYMVPSRIVACRHMPLTANGKIDNKALLAQLEDNQANHGGLVGNHQPAELERSMAIFAGSPINQIKADELESKVLDWWREALGGLEVGVQDSFFDIGGTSLELVRVHRSMEQEMRMEIPIVDLFRLATPQDVVHYLMNLKSEMTQPEIAPSVTKPGSNDFKASRAALLARCQNS